MTRRGRGVTTARPRGRRPLLLGDLDPPVLRPAFLRLLLAIGFDLPQPLVVMLTSPPAVPAPAAAPMKPPATAQ